VALVGLAQELAAARREIAALKRENAVLRGRIDRGALDHTAAKPAGPAEMSVDAWETADALHFTVRDTEVVGSTGPSRQEPRSSGPNRSPV